MDAACLRRASGNDMSLLGEVLKWSESDLALWQRDALRRLLVSGSLTQGDHEDLAALLKAEHGIADQRNRQPEPLTAAHLPATTATGAKVILLALRDLTDVNRIAPKQVMNFAPVGLTVIYGGNGSGKSGYSRVLKRACRARDADETVYCDVLDPASTARVPQAIFEIDVGGAKQVVAWKRSDPIAPDQLSGIAVFDCHCARSYLDDEQDVAFLPYGLNIVEALGREVMPGVAAKLEAEIQAISVDVSPFQDLVGATEVGRFVASLSYESDAPRLAELGTLTELQSARLVELNAALSEPDPDAKAGALRLSARRLEALATRIGERRILVRDEDVANAKSFDEATEAAIAAEKLAATAFCADDALLPGTGEAVWKALFDAAKKFSVEAAYAGMPFPIIAADAKCVLCQQPFDASATHRMQRFSEFVQKDVAKQASEKMETRRQKAQKLSAASLDCGIDAVTAEELGQLDPGALTAVQAYEAALGARRQWMLDSLESHDWAAVPRLGVDPVPLLTARSAAIVAQAAEMSKAADVVARRRLEAERAELQERDRLRQRLQPVLALLQRMKDRAALNQCKASIKTRPVSEKAKDFASAQVTERLKAALDMEFKALGVSHIKTKLKERGERGAMKHKLVLDLPVATDLAHVLSEGEQRSIAIGSFLAELTLAGHAGGIVFDDPVSSLDHERRHRVAERVVAEAAHRQVIIFTHDTVFLGELQALIRQRGTPHAIHHLEWEDKPGYVREGLPWDHMGYKERMHNHIQVQQKLAKVWPPYPNAELSAQMRREYSRLRATVERVVEDVILNGVIWRYREQVEPSRLDGVAGLSQQDCDEVKRLYRFCHGAVEAHDPASGKAKPVPDASRLATDIADLQAVIDRVLARRLTVGRVSP